MVEQGSIWRCIEGTSEFYRRLCVVKHASDLPEFNGCGDIEVLYANRVSFSGKVHRFVLSHELVKKKIRHAPKVIE